MEERRKDVNEIRGDIREVDYQIAELFEKRMKYAAELAQAKKTVGAPIYDKNREDENRSEARKHLFLILRA